MLQNINVVLSLYSVLFSFLAKEFEKQNKVKLLNS